MELGKRKQKNDNTEITRADKLQLVRLNERIYQWSSPVHETFKTINLLFYSLRSALERDQPDYYYLIVDLTETLPPKKEVLKHIQTSFINLVQRPERLIFVTGSNTVINMAAKFAVNSIFEDPAHFCTNLKDAVADVKKFEALNFNQRSSGEERKISNAARHCILGAAFGLLFPVVATLILSFEEGLSIWEAQTNTGWLIWVIDTAPIFLGIFAYLIGARQDELEVSFAYQNTKETALLERQAKFKLRRILLENALTLGLIFLFLSSISLVAYKWISSKEQETLAEFARGKSEGVAKLFKQQMQDILLALDRMADRHVASNQSSRASWRKDAENYYNHYKSFQAIEWADTRTIVKWIYPLTGNEAAIQLKLDSEPKRAQAIKTAIESKSSIFTNPIQLKQGGIGFLSIHPTYNIQNKHTGIIVAVFRAQNMFSTLLDQRFAVTISMNDQEVYSQSNPSAKMILQNQHGFTIGGTRFDLDITPSEVLIAEHASKNKATFFLILFLGISATLSAAMTILYALKRKAEKADSEKNLILSEIKEGIYGLDLHGNTTFVNQSVETMLGYSEQELLGKSMHSLIHYAHSDGSPYDREKCPMYEAFKIGVTNHVTNEVLWKKDGTPLPVDYTASPIVEDGQIRGAVVTFVDVTESRAFLEALKESEETLREAQKIAKIGSWSFDVPSKKISWTDQMFEIFPENIKEGEPSFDRHYETIYSDDRKLWTETVEKCLEDGEPYIMQFRTQHPDGKIVWVRAHGRGRKDLAGNVTSLHGTCQDISDEKKAQDSLEKQKQIAQHQAKLASIGELAAGVGHEINNPLAIANGNIYQLKKDLENRNLLNESNKRIFEKYENASLRIEKIVKGLRTFARSDSNRFELIDINLIVKQTISLVHEIYSKTGISIESNTPNQPIYVKGNSGRIEQALMNLLSNAKDALEGTANSRISVTMRVLDSSFQPKVLISVADNGKGIPKELHEKIFDNFFTTKEVGKGTGMGLALTANIIKEHEGTLELQSEGEAGTTFTIHLPVAMAVAKDEKKNESVGQTEETNNFHIVPGSALIVDDEKGIREILGNILIGLGYQIDDAEDGIEGLEKIKRNTYDVVFTDMQMPRMNGQQMVQEIHALQMKQRPKIFAVTGGVNIDFSEESESELSKLVDGYLFKPFDEEKMKTLLAQEPTKKIAA